MKRTIADKAEIFQQLIRLHEQELAIEKESIERLKNSDSFTAAVAKARARVLRIEQLLQEFRAQALFSKVLRKRLRLERSRRLILLSMDRAAS